MIIPENFGRWPYKPLARYPHLVGADLRIWARFMSTYPDRFHRVDYDVHVGRGQPIPPQVPPNIQKSIRALTQRRIDVLAWGAGAPTLIELKDYAGVSAIGQLLCYRELLLLDFPDLKDVRLLLITNQFNRDTYDLCRKFKIEYKII